MYFNKNFVVYGFAGLCELFIGIKYLITEKAYGILVNDYSGKPAMVVGILDLAFGLALLSIPYIFKSWQKSNVQRFLEYLAIALVILLIERIPLIVV